MFSDSQSIIEPILHPMDASMLTRFTFYDLQSIIELILHPMDASTLLDSHSNDFIQWMLVCN